MLSLKLKYKEALKWVDGSLGHVVQNPLSLVLANKTFRWVMLVRAQVVWSIKPTSFSSFFLDLVHTVVGNHTSSMLRSRQVQELNKFFLDGSDH